MNGKDKIASKLHVKPEEHARVSLQADELNLHSAKSSASNVDTLISKSSKSSSGFLKSEQNGKLILGVVLAVLLIGIVVVFFAFPQQRQAAIAQQPQGGLQGQNVSVKPVVFLLRDSTCVKCFDLSPLVEQSFKGSEVKILEFSSLDGKEAASKYKVSKLPVVIVENSSGLDSNVLSALQSIATRQGDALVLYSPVPPYLDLASGKLVGEVELTVIRADACKECSNYSDFKAQLEQQGVLISNFTSLDSASNEGKALIGKYNVSFAPFVIFSNGLASYSSIAQGWSSIGVVASDGSFVQTVPVPPFLNLSSSKIEGLVSVVYINDSSCKECYDVTVHKRALEEAPLNLKIASERTVDASSQEGKVLLAKYNLSQVPTVIVSKEASLYSLFMQVWPQIGVQAQDGSFVISDLSRLTGITFKDLKTGNVTTTQVAQSQQAAN